MAADTTLAASDPGVDQAQFSVFLARNVERDLVRLENRRDLRCFLQGVGLIIRILDVFFALILRVDPPADGYLLGGGVGHLCGERRV